MKVLDHVRACERIRVKSEQGKIERALRKTMLKYRLVVSFFPNTFVADVSHVSLKH